MATSVQRNLAFYFYSNPVTLAVAELAFSQHFSHIYDKKLTFLKMYVGDTKFEVAYNTRLPKLLQGGGYDALGVIKYP